MKNGNVQVVNIDDLDHEAIEKKFEMLSPEGVKEMAKNFGAPNIPDDEDK